MAPSTATDLKQPVTRLTLRDKAFCAWLQQGGAGERVVYHRGHLAVDRIEGQSRLSERARDELSTVADRAWSLAEQGLLILVQRCHGVGDFSYYAVRSKRLSDQKAVASSVQPRKEAA